jgi:hypothetical protein
VTGGPATATRLSKSIPEAPGSLSYHLRQLAKYGYIEEAPEMGTDGRERWWRAVPGGVRWSPSDVLDGPGGRAAVDAAQQAMIARQLQRLHDWQAHGLDQFGPEWSDAAVATDIILYLSAEELRQLAADLNDLIVRWANRSHRNWADAGTNDRQQVFVFTHAFPIDNSSALTTGSAGRESQGVGD